MRRVATQIAQHLTTSSRSDGELLAEFLHSGTEAAFAEVIRRHGPLVWGVCRRSLPDVADAEDAFQAIFLVLLRRGGRITSFQTIAPWLHRVATWTAKNIRRRNARRIAKQEVLHDHLVATRTNPDLPLDLDAALLALPEKYRSPIVLCHLLGFSRAEAATKLGCPEGTLSAWLSRGLAKLRAKFGSLDPAKVLGVGVAAVPAGLSTSAVGAAAAARVASSVAANSTISHIVEGVMHMFWVKKATAASMALFAVFALGMGVGVAVRQGPGLGIAQEVKKRDKPQTDDELVQRLENMIADAKKNLLEAEAALEAARVGVKLTEAKIDLYKGQTQAISEVERLSDQIVVLRFKQNEAEAKKKIAETKEWLEKYQQAKRDPQLLPKLFREIEIHRRLIELQAVQQATVRAIVSQQEDLEKTRRALEIIPKDIAAEKEKLENVHKAIAGLLAERAKLAKQPAWHEIPSSGSLELTLHSKSRQFEFTLKETDAKGQVIGTVTVREPAMLTKLLARIRNDPTSPKELRVITDPSVATNGYVLQLFRACEQAGYKTIKFTGYMPKNNFLPELKSDQKGDARGFKHYDAADREPSSLIKEMEQWMRTW